MKKKAILLLSLISMLSLSGCELFDFIKNNIYPDLETYFEKNGFTKSLDASSFNQVMADHVYFWSKSIQTYTNSDAQDLIYNSPRGDHISDYQRNNQITIYSRYAEKIVIFNDEPHLRYQAESGEEVSFKDDQLYYKSEADGYYIEMDDEHSAILKYHEYHDGYLFVTQNNFLFYLSKDFKTFYINTEDNAKFTNYEGSLIVKESELLTSSLNKIVAREPFYLPLPSNYERNIYHKDYYSDDEWKAYNVIFPEMKAVDYVNFLKEQGFEIYRGEYHELMDIDRENGGEWVVYDPNHEFDIHLQYDSVIAVTSDSKPSYGVELHIRRAEMQFSYYGLTVNNQSDWKDDEKAFMNETFGRELPFINLGRHYHINKTKRDNGEMPLASALEMDVQCYWIYDNFYKDVISDNYGQLLEEAGFSKYIPPVSRSSSKEDFHKWFYSEDCKYYECYLDDDHDLAIKFLFDDIYGNTIKIFKKSELVEWSNSLEEKDKK